MKIEESGAIDALKKPDEIRAEPLALPAGFEWSTIDVLDDAQVRASAATNLVFFSILSELTTPYCR